jgi:F-type H+-transporting ATPase subunit delta
MRGSSAASFRAVRAGYEPVLQAAGEEAAVLGAQLFSVVDALLRSASLRRAVSDPSRSGSDKAALAHDLLDGRADPRVADLVAMLAEARWSSEEDLVDAVEELAATSVFASAEARGDIETVEDELFRLDRAMVGQRELRRSLVDRSASPQARADLVRALLEGRVCPATLQLATRGAFEPRGRTMSAMLARMGRLAAHRRRLLVASVTAAAPLSASQAARLTAVLGRTYGREVRLTVALDPEVVGGLKVQVGAQMVDGTTVARLDDVRRRLAG